MQVNSQNAAAPAERGTGLQAQKHDGCEPYLLQDLGMVSGSIDLSLLAFATSCYFKQSRTLLHYLFCMCSSDGLQHRHEHEGEPLPTQGLLPVRKFDGNDSDLEMNEMGLQEVLLIMHCKSVVFNAVAVSWEVDRFWLSYHSDVYMCLPDILQQMTRICTSSRVQNQ